MSSTNLDYYQTWAWNLTLLAKRKGVEGIELFREVLRASASPPVAFPPVEIDGHMFVDGGVRQNILVIGLAGGKRPDPPLYGPGNVYLIHNGRFMTQPAAVRGGITDIADRTLGTMTDVSMQSVLLRAYIAVHSHGYNFHLVEIPPDADIGNNMLGFETETFTRRFQRRLHPRQADRSVAAVPAHSRRHSPVGTGNPKKYPVTT